MCLNKRGLLESFTVCMKRSRVSFYNLKNGTIFSLEPLWKTGNISSYSYWFLGQILGVRINLDRALSYLYLVSKGSIVWLQCLTVKFQSGLYLIWILI